MVTISRAKYGVPITDIFFDHGIQPAAPSAWISFFVQSSAAQPGFVPFKTRIIDLDSSASAIFAGISSNCRYKIQRAEREGFIPVLSGAPSQIDIDAFSDFFDGFARQKSLPLANRAKLSALASANALILASVAEPGGEPLAMHAHVKDSAIGRVRLLYSASHFRGIGDSGLRNRIGRANRLLHWHEIQQLQQQQFKHYDLGGMPIDSSDEAKNAIARFKREFGGRDVVEYNGLKGNNLAGRLLLRCSGRLPC